MLDILKTSHRHQTEEVTNTMPDCLFCSIVAGEIPSNKVYEDDVCLAFLDIQPINRGHTLVVPKEHFSGLGDLAPDTAGHMMNVAQKVAAGLRASGVECEAVNLQLADGEAAGQEVFHTHLHVIPRRAGDGFGYRFPDDYGEGADQDDLAATASSLREALGSA